MSEKLKFRDLVKGLTGTQSNAQEREIWEQNERRGAEVSKHLLTCLNSHEKQIVEKKKGVEAEHPGVSEWQMELFVLLPDLKEIWDNEAVPLLNAKVNSQQNVGMTVNTTIEYWFIGKFSDSDVTMNAVDSIDWAKKENTPNIFTEQPKDETAPY